MKEWQYVKLGDVCTIERGGSPRPIEKYITNDDSGINWIKIGDTTNSMYITKTEQKIIPDGMKKSRYVQAGDFLLSNSMSFGRPYILKIDGCIHDGWLVLRDSDNKFDKRFLYYYLSAPTTYEKFKNMAVGGVVNNLNSEMVRNVYVPIPSLVEQKEIAHSILKLDVLIEKRKQQLQKLDELVKARFVEMFGHPAECRYESKTLPQLIKNDKDALKRGPFGGSLKKDDFIETGYLVYEQRHAIHNDFAYEKYYISKTKYDEMIGFKVVPGDLIISCSGVTLGRIAEIPRGAKEGIINQALLKVSLNEDVVINSYFMTLFRDSYIQDILFGFSRGSGIPNFPSMSEVKDVEFLCPPIELQREFDCFLLKIDKSKLSVQKSLEKLETLKKALMQKYFG